MAIFVRLILTPFRIGSFFPRCRTGEIRVATDPALLDRPASKKSKSPAKAKTSVAKCGATIASLQAKVERASRNGPQGRRNIGKMTHAQRDKYLFGI